MFCSKVWSAVVDNIPAGSSCRDDSSHELPNGDTNIDVMMVDMKPEPPNDDWKMVVTNLVRCNNKRDGDFRCAYPYTLLRIGTTLLY